MLYRLQLTLLASISVLLAAHACRPSERTLNPQIALHIAADSAVAPLAERLLSSYENRHPNMLLSLSSQTRAASLNAVVSGEADAALIFHPLTDRELFSTPLGYDMLVVIASTNSPVTSLSREQLRALFSGQVQSDGSFAVARDAGSSERLAFDALVMNGQSISPNVQIALSLEAVISAVHGSQAAVGYLSGATSTTELPYVLVDGAAPTQTSATSGQYPLVTQVVFVSLGEPLGDAREFLDWILSPAGQSILGQHIIPLQF